MNRLSVSPSSLRSEWLRVFFVVAVFAGPTFLWLHLRSSAPQSGVLCTVGFLVVCAVVATKVMQVTHKVAAERAGRQARVGQAGQCPEVGGFLHYAGSCPHWIASSPFRLGADSASESGSVRLRGEGARPSEAQINLCKNIGPRMEALTEAVTSALLEDQEGHWRSLGFHLTPASLHLRDDGTAELYFDVAGLPDSLATRLNPCAKISANRELLEAGWFAWHP